MEGKILSYDLKGFRQCLSSEEGKLISFELQKCFTIFWTNSRKLEAEKYVSNVCRLGLLSIVCWP